MWLSSQMGRGNGGGVEGHAPGPCLVGAATQKYCRDPQAAGALKSEGATTQYQGAPRGTPGESRAAGRGLCPHRGPEHQQGT